MTIKDTIIEALKAMESERSKNWKEDEKERLLNTTVTNISNMGIRIANIENRLDSMMDTKKAVFLILLSVLASEVLHRLI